MTDDSVLPIIPIRRVVMVIPFFYTLSIRNAQVAGQHMRAAATWAFVSEWSCRSLPRGQLCLAASFSGVYPFF